MITNNGDEFEEDQITRDYILNAAGDGIYGMRADGTAMFVNAAAVELLGWEPDDVIGRNVHEVHHHSFADGTPYPQEQCPVHASIRDGKVHRAENEVFWTKDRRAVPVEYTSTPIVIDGAIKGAVVVFRSIEARLRNAQRQAEAYEEIASLKTRLESILNAAGDGIYGLGTGGDATFVNKAAVELLGWRHEEIIGQSIHEVHHHSRIDGTPYPRDECPVFASISDGKVHRVDDEVFWTSSGEAIPVEYTSTPIIKDGKLNGAVVVFRDISERIRLREERDEAFDQIKALNKELEREKSYLREELENVGNFGDIIGDSPALKNTLAQIEAVAATPVNVLVHGESGVGKEVIARAIHARSDRSEKALVRVNCASIPEHLFESEFFGHVKGSFTGAHRDRTGRFQLADGGTLFLDEVGEIPLSLQSKLLRAIQEGQFERVGEDHTRSTDVRIIAATNRDLKKAVEAGNFREDLYYRLNVFPIEVAPLRERRADIIPLAMHFTRQICSDLNRPALSISKSDTKLLMQQEWRGNVRELKNFIERAAILSKGNRLRVDALLSHGDANAPSPAPPAPEDQDFLTDAQFRELEKQNVRKALMNAGWRVSGKGGAAELLKVKPSTLAYRIKTLGIENGKRGNT